MLLASIMLTLLGSAASAAPEDSGMTTRTLQNAEPNLETAKLLWTELPKKWTAVGWKEHITRFNVLFDGTIVNFFSYDKGAQNPVPIRPPIPEPWAQFAFYPGASSDCVPAWREDSSQDLGDVLQGWNDSDTPVLWSEWAWGGYLLRQQIFAHVPGGQELNRGDEPLFAWVRLSVHYAADGIPLEKDPGFGVRINNYAYTCGMELRHNLNSFGAKPKYARELKAESESYTAGEAYRILEPDGRVRIAVAPGADSRAAFNANKPSDKDSVLHVHLPPRQGAYVDLLIPMLPTDGATFDKELALGYDGAFNEAEAFWSRTPASAATFDVPEDGINQAIRRNLQHDQITAEKEIESGDTYVITGALGYGIATWATPVSIAMAGFLDPMGYHDLVAKYLKVFKDAQGTVKPPGDYFKHNKGYLGAPTKVAIVNWLPDHGAILWAIAQHGLLTADPDFVREYTPVVIDACEWIRDARQAGGHGGVLGVMPPAGASDDESRVQSCWTDGWIYKGLNTAVQFLKMTNHPRAAEFEAEANDYKATFVKAFRAKASGLPTWTDDAGWKRQLVPFAFSKEMEWQFRHLFYLDTGPMHLVFAGLMDAEDPLMKDAVDWFRIGPPSKMYRPYGNLAHVPSLIHEISSWEGCYSWNIFHTWQLGDRDRFLQGMYSLFAGVLSQQTYTVCESRGGMTSNIMWVPVVLHARMAVIDDQIKANELHLLRLCPLAWLTTDRESRFDNMPTIYGPVSLRVKLDASGKTLNVSFSGKLRDRPGKIVLHIPPVPGLKGVSLNGKTLKWDGKSKSLLIE